MFNGMTVSELVAQLSSHDNKEANKLASLQAISKRMQMLLTNTKDSKTSIDRDGWRRKSMAVDAG